MEPTTPVAAEPVAAPVAAPVSTPEPVKTPEPSGTPGSGATTDGSDDLRSQMAQRLREDGVVTDDKPTVDGEPVVEPVEEPVIATEGTTTEPAKEPAKSEAEQILEDAGVKAKRADGRDNWLPYSKLAKIIDNAKTKWTTETTTKHAAEIETHTKAAKEATEWRQQAEPYLTRMQELNEIAANDADKFIQMLADVNPAYKKFLTPGAVTPAAPAKEAPARPEPDRKFDDGSVGYSNEQLNKLFDWQMERAVEAADSKLQQRLQKEQDERNKEKAQREYDTRLNQQLAEQEADARTWEGFNDHEAEILAVLQADSAEAARTKTRPKLSLEGAYRKVMFPKVKANRDTMRAELLAEINKQPKTVGAPAAVVKTVPPSNEELPLREQMKAQLRKDGIV